VRAAEAGADICYRRQETSHLAGRLYDRLADRFGEDRVFMDVDSIEPGLDFSDAIQQAVGSSDVLLALIGREWLTATDEDGRRRLDDPDDIVRLEVEAALERSIRVIPLLAEGATMPRRQDLPDSLAGLVRRNAVRLSHESFRHEAARLIDTLAKALNQTAGSTVEPQPGHLVSERSDPPQSQAERQQPSQPPDGANLKERADEQAFHMAMVSIYRQAKRDLGYNASRFLQMLDQAALPQQGSSYMLRASRKALRNVAAPTAGPDRRGPCTQAGVPAPLQSTRAGHRTIASP
jgi:hypothetical protein